MKATARIQYRFELPRLIGGHICLHACMAGIRMAAPLLALREGYSALAAGVLLALFALTQVFLALPSGRYSDLYGIRRPVRWSVLAACTGGFLAFAFPVFPVLCLSALLTGGATGTASIALQRHVGRAAQDATELKRVFGWLSIGPAISNFLGPFLAGLLIDHVSRLLGGVAGDVGSFRAAFLVMALMPLVTWWCVRHAHEITSKAPPDDSPRHVVDLLRAPMMRRLLLVNLLLSACWDVHTFVVPVIGHERDLSASVIGSILGSFALAAAAVRLTMPWLAAHLSERIVITTAMLLTALVLAIYPLMNTALAMGTCSVMLGLALGSVQPMIMSTLHQITPEHRQGEALGLRQMSINGSSVFMPMLFGTLGAVVGISVVFWVVAGAVATGSQIAWRLRTKSHSGKKSQ